MAEMELLAWGYGLIEGPRVDPEGNLYFSDVPNGGVYRRRPTGEIETVIPKRRGVGGMVFHADGGLVVGGRNVQHVKNGQVRVLFEPGEGGSRCRATGMARIPTAASSTAPGIQRRQACRVSVEPLPVLSANLHAAPQSASALPRSSSCLCQVTLRPSISV